jgi:RNA polymerase sigma-70 factor (ECF subfamily)
LPACARDLEDTDDLVQLAMLRALERVGSFEPEHPGAFLAYLRTILTNAIRDRVRSSRRRGVEERVTDDLAAQEASPLESAIGAQAIEAYEEALAELTEQQRAALMLRLELGFGWAEVADAVGSPSADAARMLVTRGVARLAERMRVES